MQAIVLAGGLGTRLRSVVPDLPKPMAPVAGRPFLAWILERLAAAGFTSAILAVGYRHEAIHAHFGDTFGQLALRYSVESAPLGTGGAIRLAAQQASDYPVFVLNGDTYVELDYAAMLAAHIHAGTRLSVGVCRVPDIGRYGALAIADGRIVGFIEKGGQGPGFINAGVYLMEANVVHDIPADVAFSFEQAWLAPRVADVRPLAFVASGRFIDIGIPEDYARAQRMFTSPEPT